MSTRKIIVKGLSKIYSSGNEGINELSFEISEGEVVYVMGESGSGKSTLIKTLAGLLDADQGTVTVNDELITGPKHNLVPGYESIAYVSQDYKLQNYWTVEDNVGKKISHLQEEEKSQEIMDWLRLFQLESYAESLPTELSGGQQQRIAIAAAVIDHPPVILLDEPFSNLDLPLKAMMRRDMIEKLRNQGTTIMLISHDPAEAMAVADKILLLRDGKIEQFDSPEELYHGPNSYYSASFLGPINELTLNKEKKLIRPENVRLNDYGEHSGIVLDSTFMGMHYGMHLKSQMSTTHILAYSKTPFEPGQTVKFDIR